MRGFVESIGPLEVRGWVAVPEDGANHSVALCLDGVTLSAQELRDTRPDLDKLKINAKIFALEIPRSVVPKHYSLLNVMYGDEVVPLLRSAKLVMPIVATIVGQVGSTIVCEIVDLRGRSDPPRIEVKSADGLSVLSRIELERFRNKQGYEGFRCTIVAYGDQYNELVAIDAETSAELLRFRPSGAIQLAAPRASQRPIGSIDTKGPVFCAGWAFREPGEPPIIVELLVDGVPFCQVEANRPRQDVQRIYGQDSLGFVLPLPRNAGKAVIEVRRKSDKQVIPGSGFSLSTVPVLGRCRRKNSTLELELQGAASELTKDDVRVDVYDHYRKVAWFKLKSVAVEGPGNTYRIPVDTTYLSRPSVVIEALALSVSVESDDRSTTVLRGQVDGVVIGLITGWVSDAHDEERSLNVLLYVDGEFQGSFPASEQRPDLKAIGFNNTKHGFAIPVPAAFCDGLDHKFHLVEARSLQPLKNSPLKQRAPAKRGVEFSATNLQLSQYRPPRQHGSGEPVVMHPSPVVSIIILTRDAAEVLDRVLESIHRFGPGKTYYELIIVDHDSRDNSSEVVEKWGADMNITLISVPGNNSFSMSNNRAAEYARGEYVIFLNNDIVLVDDVIRPAVELMRDETIGLVGIKLLEVDKTDLRGFGDKQTVHHIGIGGVDDFRFDHVRALEMVNDADNAWRSFTRTFTASVTGAFALMRKAEFISIGGFDEEYFYGGEDVDLGLKVWKKLAKSVVSYNRLAAFHHRGYLRLSRKMPADLSARIAENNARIQRKWGLFLRHWFKVSLFSGDMIFSQERLRIAFVVAQRDVGARTGELFTALELAEALKKLLDCEVIMKSPDDDWSDFSDVHVIINMLSEFSLSAVQKMKSTAIKIAWLRNSFERWAEAGELEKYSLILSSSARFVEYLREQKLLPAYHFEIASNVERMKAGSVKNRFRSDVVFNGSNNGGNRSIAAAFDDVVPAFSFKVVGAGWENTSLEKYSVGFASYDNMPDVYASTQIVVDDANTSAREWGGVNSRVFDALAAGVLPITNSQEASRQSFEGLLPTWSSSESLHETIQRFLSDSAARKETVERLQQIVRNRHTYEVRAAQLLQHLRSASSMPSILLVAGSAVRKWDDQDRLIVDLAGQLRLLGHRVEVQSGGVGRQRGFDVHIQIGDGRDVRISDGRLNFLMFLDSPSGELPGKIDGLDGVFVSSELAQSRLVNGGHRVHRFRPWPARSIDLEKDIEILFYGSDLYRDHPLARRLIDYDADVKIIGDAWENFIPAENVLDVRSDAARVEIIARSKIVVFSQGDGAKKLGMYPVALYRALAERAIVFVNVDQGDLSSQQGVRVYSEPKDLIGKLGKLRKDGRSVVPKLEGSDKLGAGNIIHEAVMEKYGELVAR